MGNKCEVKECGIQAVMYFVNDQLTLLEHKASEYVVKLITANLYSTVVSPAAATQESFVQLSTLSRQWVFKCFTTNVTHMNL